MSRAYRAHFGTNAHVRGLCLLVPLFVTGCPTRVSFRDHTHGAGAGGIGGATSSVAGAHVGGGSGGGRDPGSGGASPADGDGAGQAGVPIDGGSDGGSPDETSSCPVTYRCQGNLLQRCTGAGVWVVEAECNAPNGVCNARTGACVAFTSSGNFVSVGVPAAASGVRITDSQLSLAPATCNSSKTVCVRGGFLP